MNVPMPSHHLLGCYRNHEIKKEYRDNEDSENNVNEESTDSEEKELLRIVSTKRLKTVNWKP